MNNISFFCLTLNPEHEKKIKDLSYIPVGLGDKKFSDNFFTDKTGISISEKNSFYGEYTFHYWIWKNYIDKIKTEWVGFCQYRKFFLYEKNYSNFLDFKDLQKAVLQNVSLEPHDYECILGDKFSVENFKFSKIFKHHLSDFLKDPVKLINKKKRNLKFHFDLFHGKGNLETAINFLDDLDKKDFTEYMSNNNHFNPHNMFICKTNILKKYYEVVFPWLFKCEEKFGFKNLKGYGLKRIYGFLAERFLSYWFNKNFRVKELPIFVKDLSDYKNL